MPVFQARFTTSAQPRLFPGEMLMFSKQNVWYLSYRLPPWQFGEGMTIFPMRISFHVTNMRALTIFRHWGILNMEISQWRTNISTPNASEHIIGIRMDRKHFGLVKFDFWGLGKGRFGIGRTPFGKEGGEVRFLEIISQRPDKSHSRKLRIFMGVGKEADEELESAYKALIHEPQGEQEP